MLRGLWGALVVTAFTGCTSLTGTGECADGACPNGQTCDLATHLCVQNLGPTIVVLAPAPDAGVRATTLELRGTVTTAPDSAISGMSYQIEDAGVFGSITVDGGSFSAVVAVPALDGVDVALKVVARDTLNRQREVRVPLRVDDVSPTPRPSPADGERGTDLALTVDFGEPVVTLAAPVALAPEVPGGAFDAAQRRWSVTGLQFDTDYQVSVDAGVVVDALGNPNVAGGARFHTAVRPPSVESIGGLGQVVDFDASSDEDGDVTVAIETPTSVIWGAFDGKSGAFVTIDTLAITTPPLASLSVVSAVRAQIPESLRSSAVVLGDSGPRVWSKVGAGASVKAPAGTTAAIPTAPSCSEPAASPTGVALVDATGTYTRDTVTRALGFVPSVVAIRSAESWELAAASGTTLTRVAFSGRCVPTPGADLNGRSLLGANPASAPAISLALPRADRSLVVWTSTDRGRVERCESCVQTPDAGSCPVVVERGATGGLTVASAHEGGKVLGARKNGSGGVELLVRDLATDCGSTWTTIGTAPGSTGAVKWIPAMFGRKPGLLWSSTTDVHLYLP